MNVGCRKAAAGGQANPPSVVAAIQEDTNHDRIEEIQTAATESSGPESETTGHNDEDRQRGVGYAHTERGGS